MELEITFTKGLGHFVLLIFLYIIINAILPPSQSVDIILFLLIALIIDIKGMEVS